MKIVLKISSILSWFNLIVWGIIVLFFVLNILGVGQLTFLFFPFLLCVTILHSYAALQLHKSIRNPEIPLSRQTPAGIRFIGVVAAFLGIIFFADGLAVLQNTHEALQIMETQYPPAKGLVSLASLRAGSAFALICGICIVVNVLLNFRLLRWYHFMKGVM
jgi:hypothetical protein